MCWLRSLGRTRGALASLGLFVFNYEIALLYYSYLGHPYIQHS